MIPELTSSQCNWKGNQKGKGTDETPHWLNAVYIGKENYSSVIDDCILYLVNKKDLVYSNFCKKTIDFVGSKERGQFSFCLLSQWN